ncbi:MAG: uroporphyrinogen decarboxylase family protein [Candidatus Latescibacteria bacterium]|nr:uroporphyrinogen decarboxylase family protein [Candidatus Latescibacterota bacterium]
MMTSRDRIRNAISHKESDRIPIHDSPWGATVNRWRKEGMPDDIPPQEYFEYEMVSCSADLSPRFPIKILEKNEFYITETTPYGGVRKNFRDYSTTPEVIGWPIKSRADWNEIRPRLEPDYTRVDWVSARTTYERAKEEGKYITFNGAMGYDYFQAYLKTEELLMALLTDPEWIREMFRSAADLLIEMARMMMEKGFKFDGAFLFNDMGYRNGLLFSPDVYRDLLQETDEKVCSFFHVHDMPVILHSCGCVKELIPFLIESGFDCLQPLEVKAGMDLIELKALYGDKMAYMGGIDVRAMADPDPAVIVEEISSKIEVAKQGGGYIYHSDHSIPKNVSFQQYRHVMELVREHGQYGEVSLESAHAGLHVLSP